MALQNVIISKWKKIEVSGDVGTGGVEGDELGAIQGRIYLEISPDNSTLTGSENFEYVVSAADFSVAQLTSSFESVDGTSYNSDYQTNEGLGGYAYFDPPNYLDGVDQENVQKVTFYNTSTPGQPGNTVHALVLLQPNFEMPSNDYTIHIDIDGAAGQYSTIETPPANIKLVLTNLIWPKPVEDRNFNNNNPNVDEFQDSSPTITAPWPASPTCNNCPEDFYGSNWFHEDYIAEQYDSLSYSPAGGGAIVDITPKQSYGIIPNAKGYQHASAFTGCRVIPVDNAQGYIGASSPVSYLDDEEGFDMINPDFTHFDQINRLYVNNYNDGEDDYSGGVSVARKIASTNGFTQDATWFKMIKNQTSYQGSGNMESLQGNAHPHMARFVIIPEEGYSVDKSMFSVAHARLVPMTELVGGPVVASDSNFVDGGCPPNSIDLNPDSSEAINKFSRIRKGGYTEGTEYDNLVYKDREEGQLTDGQNCCWDGVSCNDAICGPEHMNHDYVWKFPGIWECRNYDTTLTWSLINYNEEYSLQTDNYYNFIEKGKQELFTFHLGRTHDQYGMGINSYGGAFFSDQCDGMNPTISEFGYNDNENIRRDLPPSDISVSTQHWENIQSQGVNNSNFPNTTWKINTAYFNPDLENENATAFSAIGDNDVYANSNLNTSKQIHCPLLQFQQVQNMGNCSPGDHFTDYGQGWFHLNCSGTDFSYDTDSYNIIKEVRIRNIVLNQHLYTPGPTASNFGDVFGNRWMHPIDGVNYAGKQIVEIDVHFSDTINWDDYIENLPVGVSGRTYFLQLQGGAEETVDTGTSIKPANINFDIDIVDETSRNSGNLTVEVSKNNFIINDKITKGGFSNEKKIYSIRGKIPRDKSTSIATITFDATNVDDSYTHHFEKTPFISFDRAARMMGLNLKKNFKLKPKSRISNSKFVFDLMYRNTVGANRGDGMTVFLNYKDVINKTVNNNIINRINCGSSTAPIHGSNRRIVVYGTTGSQFKLEVNKITKEYDRDGSVTGVLNAIKNTKSEIVTLSPSENLIKEDNKDGFETNVYNGNINTTGKHEINFNIPAATAETEYHVFLIAKGDTTINSSIPTDPTFLITQYPNPVLTIKASPGDHVNKYTIRDHNNVTSSLGGSSSTTYTGRPNRTSTQLKDIRSIKKKVEISYLLDLHVGGERFTAITKPTLSTWTNTDHLLNGGTVVDIHSFTNTALNTNDTITLTATVDIVKWGSRDVTIDLDLSDVLTIT